MELAHLDWGSKFDYNGLWSKFNNSSFVTSNLLSFHGQEYVVTFVDLQVKYIDSIAFVFFSESIRPVLLNLQFLL